MSSVRLTLGGNFVLLIFLQETQKIERKPDTWTWGRHTGNHESYFVCCLWRLRNGKFYWKICKQLSWQLLSILTHLWPQPGQDIISKWQMHNIQNPISSKEARLLAFIQMEICGRKDHDLNWGKRITANADWRAFHVENPLVTCAFLRI